jgi:hypothetical protein
MSKIRYQRFDFKEATIQLIEKADEILTDLAFQGFTVTLRTLYYQLVSRNIIANKESEYKRLGSIINDARLDGSIDWLHIADRTRNLAGLNHWRSPEQIIQAVEPSFLLDGWEAQKYRPEVWIEKDALVGVIEGICHELDVPFFSCRGYVSQSEMWRAGKRLLRYVANGQRPMIFHLGDHDPSGLDMTRDIRDRIKLFMGGNKFDLTRLALNKAQIEEYDPPPNPTKVTDSRANGYIALHGDSSWELDALEPRIIRDIIREAILGVRDEAEWAAVLTKQEEGRKLLGLVAAHWDEVATLLNSKEPS